MVTDEQRYECAFCTALAITDVHAQWSLFDFDYLPACVAHVEHARRHWARRWVDGNPPAAIWTEGHYKQEPLL
jgi:hypothetical protein